MTRITINEENRTCLYGSQPIQSSIPEKNNIKPRISQKSDDCVQQEKKPQWLQALSLPLQTVLMLAVGSRLSEIQELRLRVGRPLMVRLGQEEITLGQCIWAEDIENTMRVLSQNSLYAWEEEIRNGFLTLPGGHRVGLAGRIVLDRGQVKTIKDFSGINMRIGRQVLGCADKLLPHIVTAKGVFHTLIVSPPLCGKTTLLRDMVRQISDGVAHLKGSGFNVGLIDERSEIAGMVVGVPQYDVGLRTDVLDACPKAVGMMMAIRALSPQVIATDEIGKAEDIEALYQALNAGVAVITTVHGNDLQELKHRPFLKELIEGYFFQRVVILSRRRGPGTVEKIIDGQTQEEVSHD